MASIIATQTKALDGAPDDTVEPTAPEPATAAGPKQTPDQGAILLPDMEHLVWLARKVRNVVLLRRLFKNEGVALAAELIDQMDKAKGVLPPPVRKTLFAAVAGCSPVTRQRLERVAERVELLDDESGKQAVLSLLDDRTARDAAVLQRHGDAHGRALYLYLEQEYPEKESQPGERFDRAERVQVMNRQWKSEAYSNHYQGPKGPTPALDATMEERFKDRILEIYPQARREDVLIEHFTRRDLAHAQKHDGDDEGENRRVVLDTITVTFNGTEAHYKKVEHGEVVMHDDLAALSIRYSREPSTGALSVFSDDRDIRRELAAIFRDVVLAAEGEIEDLPMREFDLSGFATPAILEKLTSARIDGVESIHILHLKVQRPRMQRTVDEAKDRVTVQELSSSLTIGRDRRDSRDIYTVARDDYPVHDLTGYVLAQVKLVVRIGKQRHRRAHNVTVQITAPNGFNDLSKTEDDRRLVLAQIEKFGVMRQF